MPPRSAKAAGKAECVFQCVWPENCGLPGDMKGFTLLVIAVALLAASFGLSKVIGSDKGVVCALTRFIGFLCFLFGVLRIRREKKTADC